MVDSTRDIKAIDPVTGDTVWDEPDFNWDEPKVLNVVQWLIDDDVIKQMSPYDALDFLRSLSIEIDKRMADLRDQIQRTDR